MRADVFLDTNILLYAISTAKDEVPKKRIARELLSRTDWGLSIQVLQEFYVNATRAAPRPAMSHPNAVAAIREFLRRPVAVSDSSLLMSALELKSRYRLSYWDAAIIAAAHSVGAGTLYSEDLNDGQHYGGVTVRNPFASPTE
jgi:predicted nucleic acid-binding protein